MARIKAITGYTLAALAIPVVLATFIGQSFLMNNLVNLIGLKVSPLLTGGEIMRRIDHGQYHTAIHQQVFDALLGETREGTVQIDWTPIAGLPDKIAENVDYDGDGQNDFHVDLDTKVNQAQVTPLTPLTPAVLSLEKAYILKDGQAVRVRIKNKKLIE